MTNRQKLLQTNEYDLLCKMNDNLRNDSIHNPCIMVVFGDFSQEVCLRYEEGHCNDCIENWLNSQVGGINT